MALKGCRDSLPKVGDVAEERKRLRNGSAEARGVWGCAGRLLLLSSETVPVGCLESGGVLPLGWSCWGVLWLR